MICTKCNKNKNDHEFRFDRPGRRKKTCKSCVSEYDKNRYRSPEAKARNQEGVKRYKKELRTWYVSLKQGKPCVECKEIFHHAAMHWDHLPGSTKVANVGRLATLGSKRKILEEIAKCELVCANCHAVRTYQRAKALDTKRVV